VHQQDPRPRVQTHILVSSFEAALTDRSLD
jgi:hypothetical protein